MFLPESCQAHRAGFPVSSDGARVVIGELLDAEGGKGEKEIMAK